MKAYNIVNRKSVGQDRIAICPKFGCTNLVRVKPLMVHSLAYLISLAYPQMNYLLILETKSLEKLNLL